MPSFFDLKVSKKIIETDSSCSFCFDIPEELAKHFFYKPGQFINLNIPIQGKNVCRSYSLSSAPTFDDGFQVTVKRVAGGLMSNHLIDSVQVGDKISVSPPKGSFYNPQHIKSDSSVLLFAAGSGISPLFSMLKMLLQCGVSTSLIYANRNKEEIIFLKELATLSGQNSTNNASKSKDTNNINNDQLTNKFESKKVGIDKAKFKKNNLFSLTHILSQPSESWEGLRGRVDTKMLNSLNLFGTTAAKNTVAYLCGPLGFMDTCQDFLKQAGVSLNDIHRESFGAQTKTSGQQAAKDRPTGHASQPCSSTQANPSAQTNVSEDSEEVTSNNIFIGPEKKYSSQAECLEFQVTVGGEKLKVSRQKNECLLDSLIQAGVNAPYSCMDGSCMACMAKVTTGAVSQNDLCILTEENVRDHEALTCQCYPASKNLEINFDEV